MFGPHRLATAIAAVAAAAGIGTLVGVTAAHRVDQDPAAQPSQTGASPAGATGPAYVAPPPASPPPPPPSYPSSPPHATPQLPQAGPGAVLGPRGPLGPDGPLGPKGPLGPNGPLGPRGLTR